jgi:hypothetical protein
MARLQSEIPSFGGRGKGGVDYTHSISKSRGVSLQDSLLFLSGTCLLPAMMLNMEIFFTK